MSAVISSSLLCVGFVVSGPSSPILDFFLDSPIPFSDSARRGIPPPDTTHLTHPHDKAPYPALVAFLTYFFNFLTSRPTFVSHLRDPGLSSLGCCVLRSPPPFLTRLQSSLPIAGPSHGRASYFAAPQTRLFFCLEHLVRHPL